MLIKPSNGRCGSGRTIFASTCASTLHTSGSSTVRDTAELGRVVRYRVLPREHSTWPSSVPKDNACGRASRKSRPSRRRAWSRAAKKKSFSGIEGDGGRMAVGPSGPGPLMQRSIGWFRSRPSMAFYFQPLLEYYYSSGLFAPLPLFTPTEYHDETHVPYFHHPQIPYDPYPSHRSHFSSIPSSSSPPHGHSLSMAPPARSATPPPSPPPPTRPSPSYLEFASTPSLTSSEPTRKLLVLDLNGTLLLRSPRPPKSSRSKYQPHPAPRRVMRRPYLTALRAYLFAPQTRAWLDVMVWSSAQPHSVEDMVLHALGDDRERLVALWARDTLGLTEDHYRASFRSPFLLVITTTHLFERNA